MRTLGLVLNIVAPLLIGVVGALLDGKALGSHFWFANIAYATGLTAMFLRPHQRPPSLPRTTDNEDK